MQDPRAQKGPRRLSDLAARLLVLVSFSFAGIACTNGEDFNDVELPGAPGPTNHLLDRASELGFGQFVALAKASTHRALLESDTKLTVFAPTNAAFALLPAGELNAFFDPGSEAALDAFVGYHITLGELDATDLQGVDQVSMVGMEDAFVDTIGADVLINDARILDSDAGADNGLIHGVDRPLEVPRPVLETLQRRGFGTLAELIDLSGLGGSINGGQLTVLGPSDAAFDALPAGELDALRDPGMLAELQARLQLHLLNSNTTASALVATDVSQNLGGSFLFFDRDASGAPMANDTAFESINLRCTDGVIHGIGTVFEELPTVGERVTSQGLLTLRSLYFAGGLESNLDAQTPLTLFGPTDAAFELDLQPNGVLDMLVDPSNLPRLQQFLRAHMVQAPLSYQSLVPGTMLTAQSGDLIDVTETAGETTLNGNVGLSVRNVYASNGVLHVIDNVLDDGQ